MKGSCAARACSVYPYPFHSFVAPQFCAKPVFLERLFGHECEVIAASIRSANHVTQAALMGADIATVPFGVLKKCIEHPLTERGLVSFLNDWEKVANA